MPGAQQSTLPACVASLLQIVPPQALGPSHHDRKLFLERGRLSRQAEFRTIGSVQLHAERKVHTFKSSSVEMAPLLPLLKLSTNRTQFLSRGTVVPPEVTTATRLSVPRRGAQNACSCSRTWVASVGFWSRNTSMLRYSYFMLTAGVGAVAIPACMHCSRKAASQSNSMHFCCVGFPFPRGMVNTGSARLSCTVRSSYK